MERRADYESASRGLERYSPIEAMDWTPCSGFIQIPDAKVADFRID